MNEIPTPESDEVFGPSVDGVRARKCRDLERRLTIAREALREVYRSSSSSRLVRVAYNALIQTAPKP